ncbi:hypothetical protein [Streptomyces sp. AK02-04a]|uniref:hypothetical protein n=1 Tax=Streptomyces sp. AK02-04a TaxID=3028649 RepID=UPI0029B763B5|nr:hypothetical protein [Streptomyces sp. AK02-04a]MDX3756275.1 hypothetical protein [Streptomyces sp. AK02-04a]
MFEIRVICNPADTDRVTTALSDAFTTGAVRHYPTRDGECTRLYVTADHHRDPGPWPTPEVAYALAPSIVREIGWTVGTAVDKPYGEVSGREYWLRKAALLDRIALREEQDGITGDADDAATEAARRFVDYDRDGNGGYHDGPIRAVQPRAAAEPRGYVRQEYAHWAKTN